MSWNFYTHPHAPELKAPRTAEAKLRARLFLIEHRHLILKARNVCA